MSARASQEEMRAARLRALGGAGAEGPSRKNPRPADNGDSPAPASTAASQEQQQQQQMPTSSEGTSAVSDAEMRQLERLLYRGGGATSEDLRRWCGQGFEPAAPPNGAGGADAFPIGLRQSAGGPCGVLAAVQAEMVAAVLFGTGDEGGTGAGPETDEGMGIEAETEAGEGFPEVAAADVPGICARALVTILARAVGDKEPLVLVECTSPGGVFRGFGTTGASGEEEGASGSSLRRHCFVGSDRECAATAFALQPQQLAAYRSPSGCILFLLGLLLTRGLSRVQADMDQPDNTLVVQFGHCTQELVNLLLTGRATSNVMDGDVALGDSGLMVRGIKRRARIGYLTHLEALQLCQVGTYYKIPVLPVWVVGSSSHFTVLFARYRTVNEETQSEQLQTRVQRAFKSVDAAECGFIPSDKLQLALMNIDDPTVYEILGEEEDVARLRGHLNSDGDIIIYSAFWETVSRLITGESLDLIMDDQASRAAAEMVVNMAEPPSAGQGQGLTPSTAGLPRTDSQIARELQAQFDAPGGDPPPPRAGEASVSLDFGATVAPSAALAQIRGDYGGSSAGGMGGISDGMTDEELARQLQAQWAADEGGMPPLAPVQAAAPLAAPLAAPPPAPAPAPVPDPAPPAAAAAPKGETLWHYNGLVGSNRAAQLTRMSLRRRDTENLIGVSVAMTGGGGSGGQVYLCPIEEVVTTRWPGGRLDFLGAPVPSID